MLLCLLRLLPLLLVESFLVFWEIFCVDDNGTLIRLLASTSAGGYIENLDDASTSREICSFAGVVYLIYWSCVLSFVVFNSVVVLCHCVVCLYLFFHAPYSTIPMSM